MSLNRRVLGVFSAVLVLAGLLGFVVPDSVALMSGAPAYNAFHIAFGLLGLALWRTGSERAARAFNFGFGLIDLYQALAQSLGWFPLDQFRWKPADLVLHLAIGLALVVVGSTRSLRAMRS